MGILITETTSRGSISSVGIVKNLRMIEVTSLLRRQNQSSENGLRQMILVEKNDNNRESLFKTNAPGVGEVPRPKGRGILKGKGILAIFIGEPRV